MASPNLNFFNTSGATVTTINFGSISAGQESSVQELILWNNKDGDYAVDDATNVVVAVRVESASEINDPLDQGWVFVKSDGIENPDNVLNFFDDDQPGYTKIDRFNNLFIGDIPDGTGRHIFVKVVVPPVAPSQANVSLRLIAGTNVQYYPLPYFFNRAFGDGTVDNIVDQIFPPILQQKIGVWTDVIALSSGAYTGLIEKDYLVRIASGTTIGFLTYQTSDNNGSSYSSAIASSTSSFTAVKTSADVDEGVTFKLSSVAGQSLAVGDLWKISVGIKPFKLIAGISSSLEGWVGHGEALVYNNRIHHQSPTLITGLTASNINYLFLDSGGVFSLSTSANPQFGKLIIGSFETDSTKVTNVYRLAPQVTMGLDLFDDFTPLWPSISGLTWVYNKGKYRKFTDIVTLPSSTLPFGTFTLLSGVTNYIQIDTVGEQVIRRSTGYEPNNVPLFRVETGSTYIKAWEDDRTRLGVPSMYRGFTGTVSSIPNNGVFTFSLLNTFNIGDVEKLVVSPNQITGTYSVAFYQEAAHTNREYEAVTLTDVFIDPVDWQHFDRSFNKTFHGYLSNYTGSTCTFTFDLTATVTG